MNLLWINKAEYMGDYRLMLTFNNGEQRIFDGKEYVHTHPVFSPLRDTSNFRNFELDGWTVSWQGGKLDISPEYLYENCV